MENKDPILRLESVVSGYGEVLVLKGVTFDVSPGQIICIIGANGAGKSTLLRTIFGMLRARDGHIYFEGDDITGHSPVDLLKRGCLFHRRDRSIAGRLRKKCGSFWHFLP